MKHFAFVSPPAYGHVNPTLPLVEELVERGHRVSYATGEALIRTVTDAGAAPVPLPSEPPSNALNDMRFTADGLAAILRDVVADTRAELPILLDVFGADRPDAVCHDLMSLSGPILADKLGVPNIALVPMFAGNETFSLSRVLMPETFDANHPDLVEASQRMAALATEFELGIDPRPLEGSVPDLNLVAIPREFQIAGDSFDERFVFVGPSLGSREQVRGWEPPADGRPVLFVSLGTAFNDRPDFFRLCLEAFGGTEWHVAMAVGEHVTRDDLGDVPANVDVRPFFPQPAVLRHASVFLTHAGMNSTMEALYFGVPLVAAPQVPEQRVNAQRAEELGLGRCLTADDMTATGLRSVVTEIHRDDRVRANLARMREIVRNCGGARLGADRIEAHLDARTAGSEKISRHSGVSGD
ncbi:macrolide family glycosyltransferase [Streptoalloteichus hindustanus]|uniref:Glycosyltransferase, MGT family n=1 Tax=Streptoalloteichus hindustanus TaxID=2017 RepID=A0A1M4YBD6_STRHI|nr:macrolide family glycosyltransferase [Streptoalloteichus hindustanus]SHF03050.1 glycosyltransferase, MGT family [Streptoalloteichus hindustanus]